MTPLDLPWLVIESVEPSNGNDLITLTAAGEKYALAFTDAERIAAFLAGLDDADGLRVATLESFVLKEAYLTAAAYLGATALLFDYCRGDHAAQAATIWLASEHVRSKIGAGGLN